MELGRNSNDTATLGSGQAAPFPRGERAVPPTLRRQVGRAPPAPRTVSSVAGVISHGRDARSPGGPAALPRGYEY